MRLPYIRNCFLALENFLIPHAFRILYQQQKASSLANIACAGGNHSLTIDNTFLTLVSTTFTLVRKSLTKVRKSLTKLRRSLTKVRTVVTKVSADLTKVRETFTMVREVLSMVRESLPNAFLLFSLKTRVGGSAERGVDRGD